MLLQLKPEAAKRYNDWLSQIHGREPNALERLEAFSCASSGNPWDKPGWACEFSADYSDL
jgi:hypothetical protein